MEKTRRVSPSVKKTANPQTPSMQTKPAATTTQQILQLQRLIGNHAVNRLLTENRTPLADAISPAPLALQRMFDQADLKGDMTGEKIWKKYTPDKDTGKTLLNYLDAQCGNAGRINTATLTAAGGVLAKIAAFLDSIFNNFAARGFAGSTVIHNNNQSRYTVDNTRPERYAEFGITGTGQTRVVLDRLNSVAYLSTHYEAPKVILIQGNAPQAAMTHIENFVRSYGFGQCV